MIFARAAALLDALHRISPADVARVLVARHGYGPAARWAAELVQQIERMRE